MRPWLLAPLALLLACAHAVPTPGASEEAQRTAGLYLKALRWEGPRASAALLAPEHKAEYLKQVNDQGFEDHLKITEYELKELGRSGPNTADASADLSWYIEPEVTVHHAVINLHLVYRDRWLVEGIEGGPLPVQSLAAPMPDAGAP